MNKINFIIEQDSSNNAGFYIPALSVRPYIQTKRIYLISDNVLIHVYGVVGKVLTRPAHPLELSCSEQ